MALPPVTITLTIGVYTGGSRWNTPAEVQERVAERVNGLWVKLPGEMGQLVVIASSSRKTDPLEETGTG